ncbi:MAG: six-hairpin glycosidase-like protein [Cyclobacteriaceae bacterium]|nr:six-hairpin glycosidase-like protein [Cyclobacteriaceae bacterium]
MKINGKLIFYHSPVEGLALRRTLFPCMDNALFVEHWELINITKISKSLKIGNSGFTSLLPGYKGIYTNQVYSDAATEVSLNPAESYHFTIYFSAAINEDPTKEFNYKDIEKGRDVFLKTIKENLVLETSNPVIDQLFYFSKIRASESIFESKMGLVHSPGGGNYYAGIWANDQVEYSGPFFPFLGDEAGIEAAKNAYLMFLRNIPASSEPIFSSFEIEGELPCCGKDRGDAAMIAYGTSQFLLRYASRDFAMHLWPLIEWSIDYCQNKINEDGVVLSKTDEMEGRISTGDANLSTNALYYGGLINASFLAKELGKDNLSKLYEKRSIEMSKNIEKHFGFKIEGLDTYRYFEGNTHLRHWICLPLVMGIDERAEATAEALLDKLWTENGVLVELNPASTKPDVFWDRGTLYALRGTFKAGFFDKSLKKLVEYSNKRLLGDHVPYAIEAYPENNMKHLSAESALYCRVILEGILGFEQTAFDEFSIVPQLSEELSKLKLSNLHIGDNSITIELLLAKEKVQAKISVDGKKKRKGVYNIGEIISVKI